MDKEQIIKEEPKFKIGDIIRYKEEPDFQHKIIAIEGTCYKCENLYNIPIAAQDSWEIVEKSNNDLEKRDPIL